MKPADKEESSTPAGAAGTESGTEVLTDGILLLFKFVETHLAPDERRFYDGLEPGEYLPLERLLPIWKSLLERIPKELRAAIKGMTYRTKGLLTETGVERPADAVRVSNVYYQAFIRGPRLGGIEVVSEGENEAVVDDTTWVGCLAGPWYLDAILRAFGARAVRIEHLTPCRDRGDRACRYRGRWSDVKRGRVRK